MIIHECGTTRVGGQHETGLLCFEPVSHKAPVMLHDPEKQEAKPSGSIVWWREGIDGQQSKKIASIQATM
jgi:hypothetical protein